MNTNVKIEIDSTNVNTVHKVDCIEGMSSLPANSVDLIVADPPYNLSKGNVWKWDRSVKLPRFGGEWRKMSEDWDNVTFEEYWDFTVKWLTEAKRVLKRTGSIWVYGTYHNIGIINTIFQLLGIEIINEIIWYKRNAFPNLSGRRFTASHENILWGHVGGKKREYYFNYEYVKKVGFPADRLNKPGKQVRTVWDLPNNKSKDELKYGSLPAQKPVALTNRLIISATKPKDLVLIPFSGAGSECISALRLGRKFIAFENDENHIKISKKRIADTLREPLQTLLDDEWETK